MTVVVWFSHPPDYGLLAVSVERVARLDPAAERVVVIDPDDPPPEVAGVNVLRRSFPRGSHLNGNPAVEGVARVLGEFQHADAVVKLDSDMVPGFAFWSGGPVAFQRPNRSFFGAYCLTGDQAAAVAMSMATNPPTIGHEAMEICRRSIAAGGMDVVCLDGFTPCFVSLL